MYSSPSWIYTIKLPSHDRVYIYPRFATWCLIIKHESHENNGLCTPMQDILRHLKLSLYFNFHESTSRFFLSLTSFSSSSIALYLSLDPLSESPRIENGRYISGSIRRAHSVPRRKIGSVGNNYRIFSNSLATLEILLELLE